MTSRERRITVIDDHDETLQLLTDVLEGDGYQVTGLAAVDPQLRALRASRPDLMVVDLLLSSDQRGLSGWDVIRLARSHADLHGLPALIISADYPTLRTIKHEAGRMEHLGLLAKPFALDELRAKVAELLSDTGAPRDAQPEGAYAGGSLSPPGGAIP